MAGPPGNLPHAITSFVGRRRDVAEVERLLGAARLVMVTGFGGVGKSRLAMQVAAGRQTAFRHGAWWVELAGVGDPELVAHTVATALRIGEQSGRPPLAALVDFLADRQLLLVLDNCEHLSEACAALTQTLLAAAPGVTILATSRQSLGIVGEYVWPLAPMAVPDPDEALPPEALERFGALELFARRAAAARPGHAMTPQELGDAARICRRLDGIPLGIEMAAVWLRTLGIPEIAARLDDRFGALTSANRTGQERHQTLHAAVQWSYELCSVPEQQLWARASVFAGSFDASAAEQVCAGGGLTGEKVRATLNALVDKSVLLCREQGGRLRFRMLETLREYGLEPLRAAGEEATRRRAHRDHYLRMAAALHAGWYGAEQLEWRTRLRAEHANLRAALEYCLTEPGEKRVGLRMAAELWFYWLACGQLREGRHWLDRALAADPQPSRERAAALVVDGFVMTFQRDLAPAEEILEQARTVARHLGADNIYARANIGLGIVAERRMDSARATELCHAALGRLAAMEDSFAPLARMIWLMVHGTTEPARAMELSEECLRSSAASGDQWILSWVHLVQAHAAWLLGRLDEATHYARQSLRTQVCFADGLGIVSSVERLAWITSGAGDHARAAVLLGAAQQGFQHFGLTLFEAAQFAKPHDACETRTRTALGDTAYEAALRRGTAFSIDEAVAYALGEERAEPADPRTPSAGHDHQTADLVAEDLTSEQISSRLMIAEQQRDLADLMRREIIELSAIHDPDQVITRLAATLTKLLPADLAVLVRGGPTGYTSHAFGTDDAPAEQGLDLDVDVDVDVDVDLDVDLDGDGADGAALAAMMESPSLLEGSSDQLPGPLVAVLPGTRCWLASPLVVRGHRAGLLILASRRLNRYDEAQTKIGAAFIAQAMVAYDNALLFRQVQQLATTDELSGLHNRRHLVTLASQQIAVAARQDRPVAVAMVDIDNFKHVNDTYGHAVGDQVIRAVADRIKDSLRFSDVVGRYGGEEFVVVLPEFGKDIGMISERLRAAIAGTPVPTTVGPLPITVSIGTAVADGPENSLDALLDRADKAMYEAKQSGRNRVCHG